VRAIYTFYGDQALIARRDIDIGAYHGILSDRYVLHMSYWLVTFVVYVKMSEGLLPASSSLASATAN